MPSPIRTISRDDVLVLDIGTGSIRAALVTETGKVHGLTSVAHQTQHSRHGWVEQRPADWWRIAQQVISKTMTYARDKGREVRAICCCAHMHAPVLIDESGGLVTQSVPLWNDKRAALQAQKLALNPIFQQVSGNPPTTAWPGVKLAWMRDHQPELINHKHTVLMSKDYINFKLCGRRAMDMTEAGSSLMCDAKTRTWSAELMAALGLPAELLPNLVEPTQIIGNVDRVASEKTNLPQGLPVIAGMGDYPAALLGSGADPLTEACNITGTSALLTLFDNRPVIHDEIMNVATGDGGWGAFCVVDAAGDSLRWTKDLMGAGQHSYTDVRDAVEKTIPCGNGLTYLPYLTGERLGQGDRSRGAFLGLTIGHDAAQIYRSVLEGVAFAMRQAAEPVFANRPNVAGIVAAAGGARNLQWLQIKADILNLPITPTAEVEAGLLGCAATAKVALGDYRNTSEAIARMVHRLPPILPQNVNRKAYQEGYALFRTARRAVQPINEQITKARI